MSYTDLGAREGWLGGENWRAGRKAGASGWGPGPGVAEGME